MTAIRHGSEYVRLDKPHKEILERKAQGPSQGAKGLYKSVVVMIRPQNLSYI